jgi:hypothetical protein
MSQTNEKSITYIIVMTEERKKIHKKEQIKQITHNVKKVTPI